MPHMREVKTCDRCRHFKRRCDLLKPSCSRCVQAGVRCSFDVAGTAAPPPSTTTATATATTTTNPAVASSAPSIAASLTASSASPGTSDHLAVTPTNNGLISPTTSTESPEPHHTAVPSGDAAADGGATGGAPSAAAQRIIRKRKRNCLSCLRCHRLKVKCDKELPCGRCKSSGNGRECYYSYNKGPNGGKFPCPTAPTPTGETSKAALATWQYSHSVRGSSHWRDLMTKIVSLGTIDAPTLTAALENVATNACLANFNLPGNFPFGTPGATKYYARDAVTRLIEGERPNIQKYINVYIELLDCVNPVIDIPQFHRDLEQYWQDPHAFNLCWLSQLLMVMGLGCFVSTNESHAATELMMAAEACLMQTPFMFRPTMLTLKTMCLMVVAKQVCNATCWAIDSCWSLLGLLVRMAFVYGLPHQRTQTEEEVRDPEERDARRKLWLTILYMDIKVATSAGMPPLTRPDELGCLRNTADFGQPDSLQMVLYQALPTVLDVLAHINSHQNQISYPDVLRYNAQLRQLMAHAERVCSTKLQRITMDIFLRRCLMVMHRPFALHQEGPVMFPESYWSSLECSLALLVHYRELYGGEPDLRLDLVGRAFVLDFFSATLTACLHVLRTDAPLAGASSTDCQIPPRQIILETLRSCIEIWGGEQEKSVCWRTGHTMLVALLGVLPAS
ncbi:Transcription factor asR3 [Paramyrothecium foliicola]|nr:Transcription factor asR3 [Paramyrothecium foliicola]